MRAVLVLSVLGALLAGFVAYIGQYKSKTPLDVVREYAGAPAYESLDIDKPIEEQTRIVEIGDRRFEIPIIYIASTLRPGEKQNAVILNFVLPDFTHRADFQNRQAYEEARLDGRFASVYIEQPGKKVPLEIAIDNFRQGLKNASKQSEIEGLSKEIWYRKRGGQYVPYYDVYIEKNNKGDVLSYFECTSLNRVKVPHCAQMYFRESLYFRVSYAAQHLKNWVKLKKQSNDFIKRFEIN